MDDRPLIEGAEVMEVILGIIGGMVGERPICCRVNCNGYRFTVKMQAHLGSIIVNLGG
jgi:hypothetical protein